MKYILSTSIFIFLFSTLSIAQVKYYGGVEGKKLDWVMYYLNEHYVDSTDNSYLTDVAIRSIMQELDPYSVYQSVEELKEMQEADQGYSPESYGFAYYAVGDTSFVTFLNKGGPADIAGLEKSDRIIRVNGVDVIGTNHSKIAEFMTDQSHEDLLFLLKNPLGIERSITIKKDIVP